MILLQGKGVSKGVTSGPIYFFRRSDATVTKCAADIEAEKARLAEAQEKSIEQLNRLGAKAALRRLFARKRHGNIPL